jgi:hypothetical protein
MTELGLVMTPVSRTASVSASLSAPVGLTQEEQDLEFARQLEAQLLAEDTDVGYTIVRDDSRGRGAAPSATIPPLMGPIRLDLTKLPVEQRRTLAEAAKRALVPIVAEMVTKVSVPPVDQTLEVGKLGEISVGINGMTVETVTIPEDKVHVTIGEGEIGLEADGIMVATKPFAWRYRKGKLHDDGTATAAVSRARIRLVVEAVEQSGGGGQAVARVKLCNVSLGKLSIKIKGTKARVLYDIILAVFKRLLVKAFEQAITQAIAQGVE